jgi:hypothetical protein
MKPPIDTTNPPNDTRTIDLGADDVEPLEKLVTWTTSRMLLSARMHLTPTPRDVRPAHCQIIAPAVPLAG